MAPENTTPTAQTRVTSGQTVTVPRPGAGAEIAVTSSPAGVLDLAFDPSAATVTRVDNSLVFEMDDGGKVTITDFFAVGDESLPDLKLPDGAEVASLDFFEGTGLDMSTAAGPNATPPGSGTSGVDGGVDMTGGVSKQGKLGTDYWEQGDDPGEEMTGLDMPGGSFSLEFGSFIAGLGNVVGVFEDARPFQHLGDTGTVVAAQLHFTPQPGAGSSVGDIRLSGFPEGSRIFLGDPADSDAVEITEAGGSYTLTADDFSGSGVYVVPPANSDADFTVSVEVDFVRGGATVTVSQQIPVIVDAVADRPEDIAGQVDSVGLDEAVQIKAEMQQDGSKDGWRVDSGSTESTSASAENVRVSSNLTVALRFSDYGENDAADQGESHYALVEVPPGEGWSCTYNGVACSVISVYLDASGNPLPPVWNAAANSFDYDTPPPGAVSSKAFFQVPVDNADILAADASGAYADKGTIEVSVVLEGPGNLTQDTSHELITGGMALEANPSGGELNWDNNAAVNFADGKASLDIDVIDSRLTLKLGWFAESGDGTKNDAAKVAADYDPYGAAYDDASNQGMSAKISLSVSDGEGPERISEISFTVDQARGLLQSDGHDLTDGAIVKNGTTYEVSVKGDTVTITISGNPVTSLDDLDLSFKPAPGYDSTDVPFEYKVTVLSDESAGGSGAQAVFSGESSIVADAVADLPGALDIDHTYGKQDGVQQTAVAPGQAATIKGEAAFADNDGSEAHYLVVSLGNPAWTIDGLGNNSNLLSKGNVNEVWNTLTGGKIPAEVMDGVLDGAGDSRQHLLVEAKMVNGAWQVRVYADIDGDGVADDVTQTLLNLDPPASFSFNPATGVLEYSFALRSDANAAADDSATLHTRAVTVEVPGDGEYDYANNIAVVGDQETTVNLDVVTARLSMSLSMAEDGQSTQRTADQASLGFDTLDYKVGATSPYYQDPANRVDIGAPVSMSLTGGSASEFVKTVTVTELPHDAGGNLSGTLYYAYKNANGDWVHEEVVPGKVYNVDADTDSGFYFKPNANFSGDLNMEFKAEISSRDTHVSVTQAPSGADIHVDSVADKTDADSSLALGDRGRGDDTTFTPGAGQVDDKGWYTQTSGRETSVEVKYTLTAAFHDLDGSERGFVFLQLPEGYELSDKNTFTSTVVYLPKDANGKPIIDYDANGNLITVADPAQGLRYALISVDPVTADYSVDVYLDVASSAPQTTLENRVVTQEKDLDGSAGHSIANNVAVEEAPQNVAVDHFESSFTVKAGWGYEDNNANKFGGTASGPENSDYAEAQAGAQGIPINVSFSPANGETLSSLTLTFSGGTLYRNGFPVNGNDLTLDANDLLSGNINLYFVPDANARDEDISFNYTATVKNDNDPNGTEFTVNGAVKAVIDAVADIGRVTDTDVEAKNAAVTDGVYDPNMAVEVTVTAQFTDWDGSEKHYILVEKPVGLLPEAGQNYDSYTVYYDAGGKPMYPVWNEATGVYDAPTGYATSKEFYRFDVTGASETAQGAATDYTVRFVADPAHSGTLADQKLVSGSMSEEKPDDGEYDYSNNIAFDLSGKADLNMMDSVLKSSVADAYEDHQPTQNTILTPPADQAGGWIKIEVGKGSGSDFAGKGGDYVDNGGNIVIEFTFNPADGSGALPGSFAWSGGSISYPNANYSYDPVTGKCVVTIPASSLTGNNAKASAVDIRYTPTANDDTDLGGLKVSVPVKSEGTGYTTTLTTEPETMIVDAVADKPLTGAGQVTADGYDGNAQYDAANWGSEITVRVNSTFNDYADGSEKHYLIIEAREGWSCTNADGVVKGTDNKLYFFKDVSSQATGNDGVASFDFELVAPSKPASSDRDTWTDDQKTINGDGTVVLQSGGFALEGAGIEKTPATEQNPLTITQGSTGNTISHGNLQEGVNEIRVNNNEAQTTGNTNINFNVVNPGTGSSTGTYEDGHGDKHYDAQGTPSGSSVNATVDHYGTITVALGQQSNDSIVDVPQGAASHHNYLTFTYAGPAGTLGKFYYNDGGNIVEISVVDLGNNSYRLNIPNDAISNSSSVTIQYHPADSSVSYASDDITGLEYHLKVSADTSKAVEDIGGPINNLIVDAVADRPDTGAAADAYDGGHSAAVAGGTASVVLSDVRFFDYADGSEAHYLVVKTGGVAYVNEDRNPDTGVLENNTGTANLGIAQQTITLTGTGADGAVITQVVIVGADAASSSIQIFVNGVPLTGWESPKAFTQAQYDNLMNDGISINGVNGTFAAVPVLNEFLQQTTDGTVSASVKVELPDGQLTDTDYSIPAGGHAVESEIGGGLSTGNDTATDLKEVIVEVGVVTSGPSISVTGSQIYENLTPNAHLDPDVVAQYFADLAAHKADPSLPKPAVPAGGIVDKTTGELVPDGQGARFELNDLHVGESADVTLIFSATENGQPVDFSGGSVTLFIGGVEVPGDNIVWQTNPDGSRQATITGINLGNDPDAKVEFVFDPGDNYSHVDISVDYVITVTDDASGASKTWGSTEAYKNDPETAIDPGQVAVDAVAQRPEFVPVDGKEAVAVGKDGAAAIEKGQNFTIKSTVDFQDIQDGSQQHYVLVEASAEGMFKPLSVTLTVTVDGQPYSVTVSGGSATIFHYGGTMYYRLPVSEALDDILEHFGITADSVQVDLGIVMNSYKNSGDAKLQIGVAAHEDSQTVLAGGSEKEYTLDNNTAFVISEIVDVTFDDSSSSGPGAPSAGWVYENNEPGAHLGSDAPGAGAIINLNLGSNATLLSLQVTIPQAAEGAGLAGSLYYVPKGSGIVGATPLTADGGGKVTVSVQDGYELIFVPADNNSDADVKLSYTGEYKNTNTNETTSFGNSVTVYVDAVAQKPDVVLNQGADPDVQGEGSVTFTVTFTDVTDGSTDHYVLFEHIPGWESTFTIGGVEVAPVGTINVNGKGYWQIPVTDALTALADDKGSVTVSVDIEQKGRVFGDTPLPGTEHSVPGNQGNFKYGGMSVDNTNDIAGDRELTLNNNIAYDLDNPALHVDHHTGHHTWNHWEQTGPAFENDRPLANTGVNAPAGGAGIHIPTSAHGEEVVITVPKGAGTLTGVGAGVPDANGNLVYTFTPDENTAIRFVPGENNKDNDVTLNIKVGDNAPVNSTMTVDAVAQAADSLTGAGDYPGSYEAFTPGAQVTIEITADFPDRDGSENHYILVKAEPGLSIAESQGFILVEGEAYYKVPVTGYDPVTGEAKVSLTVTGNPDAYTSTDGMKEYDLTIRTMSEETVTDKEITATNNVAVSGEQEVSYLVSEVNSYVTSFEVTNTFENDGYVNGQQVNLGGEISIGVSIGAHDSLTSLLLQVPDGGSVVTANGPIGDSFYTQNGNLDLGALLEDKLGKSLGDMTAAEINKELADMGLRFATDGYEDIDLSGFNVSLAAVDTKSGHSGGHSRSDSIVVDAVAHAPIIETGDDGVSLYTTWGDNEGSTSATSGGTLHAQVELSFEDIGAGEEHYAILGQDTNWPCTAVYYYDETAGDWVKGDLVTFFDKNGKPYYALKIADDMFEQGSNSIKVMFDIKAPETAVDQSTSVRIGGASIETNMGLPTDLETTLANNWAETDSSISVPLTVGVVDSTLVTGNPKHAHVTEDQGDGSQGTLISFVPDNASDEVVGVTILEPQGGLNGSIYYKGTEYSFVDGKIVLPPTADEPFDPDGVSFVPDPYWSGTVNFDFEATVRDIASRDVSTTVFKNSVAIVVDGLASTPTEVTDVQDRTGEGNAVAGGENFSFTVTASFPDLVGEDHYVLIEVEYDVNNQPVWGNPAGYGIYSKDGVDYYKVKVPSTGYNGNEGTVTVTLTAPDSGQDLTGLELGVGALAEENGTEAFYGGGDKVVIDIGVVESDDSSFGGTGGSVGEVAPGSSDYAPLTFTFDAGSTNEVLNSITLTLPNEGDRIYDAASNTWLTAGADGKVVIQGPFAPDTPDGNIYTISGYGYQPAAYQNGEQTISYSAEVRDKASGATETVTGMSVSVDVSAVTNTPEGPAATPSGPVDSVDHVATMTVTLSANFMDYTGSEAHYFLVSLPDGISPPASWGQPLDDGDPRLGGNTMDGTVYCVYVDQANPAANSVNFSLTVTPGYDPATDDNINYAAGSYEKGLYDPASPALPEDGAIKVTGGGTSVTVNVDGLDFNMAPTVSPDPGLLQDFLRNPDQVVGGNLHMDDPDSQDTPVVTEGGLHNGAAGTFETENGVNFLVINGLYGELKINVNSGAYTYTLNDGAKPPQGYEEVFDVTVSDQYLGGNKNIGGSITVTLQGNNAAPTAVAAPRDIGGNVDPDTHETAPLVGQIALSDADAGDMVSITGIKLGGMDAVQDPDTGLFTIEGEYGTLVMDAQGHYTYTLYNETASGSENFVFSYSDQHGEQYGGTGQNTLTINVSPVNHAPVAQDVVATGYNPATSTTFQRAISLSGLDPDGDAVSIAAVTCMVDGVEKRGVLEGNTYRIEGEYGTLWLRADGFYQYQRFTDSTEMDKWDSFTYSVADAGGLSSSAQLHVGIGNPDSADLPESVTTVTGAIGSDDPIDLREGAGDHLVFGYSGNDTIYGGPGSDTIYGGAGDDVIYAGGSVTEIHGGSGHDQIFAGVGDDILFGGTGDDTFIWSTENLGGNDVIKDFDFNYTWGSDENGYTLTPGADSGGTRLYDNDLISFKDIFGDPSSVENLLTNAPTMEDNGSFTFSDGSGNSLTAQFLSKSELALTLGNEHGELQTITVEAATQFYDQNQTLDAQVAQTILETIIKDYSS